MAVVRSMRGQPVDFDRLMAQNPHKVALGNARMNARGDRLGPGGKILVPREAMIPQYNKSNPKAVKQVPLNHLAAEVLANKAITPAEAVNTMRRQKKTGDIVDLTEQRPRGQGAVPLVASSLAEASQRTGSMGAPRPMEPGKDAGQT